MSVHQSHTANESWTHLICLTEHPIKQSELVQVFIHNYCSWYGRYRHSWKTRYVFLL